MAPPKRTALKMTTGFVRNWYGVVTSKHDDDPTTVEYILATEHARIVAEKDARIAELEEALEWYSDETQYVNTCEQLPCECCTDIFKPIERDEGSIARAALKGDDNG